MVRPADGGGGGDYSSITPEVMNDLVSNVKGAGSTIQTLVTGYQGRASGMGVSTVAFSKLLELGSWAEDQVPMLQRRLTLAQAMETKGSDGYSPVYLSEPMSMTSAEAEAKGRELAKKLQEHNRTDGDYVKLADSTMDELIDLYGNDPDVVSAFYGQLGPQGSQTLLTFYEASGGTDTDYVRKVSETFAAAFKDSDPSSDFTQVRSAFTVDNQGDHGPDPMSWERLAMLQYGDFPSDFVRDVVNANGLDKLNDDPDNFDWRNRIGVGHLGIPDDNRTLLFGALKNNPDATRWAFDGKDLDQITKGIYGEGSFDFDLQQNFIDAMKAGSGVDDEQMGHHSAAASEFALAFIKASAAVKDVPDLWNTKEGLADIAASYAPEFVAGSNLRDAGGRESSMDRPDHYDVPPGLDPAFYLSSQDVYRFLHGFGQLDERFDPPHDFSEPFDAAVGQLYDTSLSQAVAELKKHPDHDVWDDTLAIYGNLSGLQLQAQLDVRGDQDETDQHNKDLISGLLIKGVGLVPTPQGWLVKGGLMAGKFIATKAIKSWRDIDPETTRAALLHDADVQASFLNDYQLMNALQQGDFPGTDKIPPALIENGHLKSPQAIANDADLIEKYQDWVDSTDGPTDTDLDSLTENGKGQFQGGIRNGQSYGEGYGWDD